jgi:hypothetical protein
VAGGAGDGEDERRPARSCGRLPSFSLLFLLLPFFPSPASREIQRAAMRPERGWWPRSREQPCGQREDGSRRRRWPPRRCVRSPEGERAAVERLSDGARGPVPHASERQRSGERSTRPVRRHSAHQGGAGGGDSKVRPW